MYQIVFAEDEKALRDNICSVIDWQKYDFNIAATASDGEEALQAVRRCRPDVLIADIRMPFMDGLELSRQAKKLLPSIKIIILSGFMEFSYAQEAIRIGVQEYIVKPVTPVKLIRILIKLNEQLQEENEHQAHVSQLVNDLRNAESLLQTSPGGDLYSQDISQIMQAEEQTTDFLLSGSTEKIGVFTNQLFLNVGESSFHSTLFRSFFLLKIAGCCVKALEDMNGDPQEVLPQFTDLKTFLAQATTIPAAKAMLNDCLSSLIRYRAVASNATAGMVDKAKMYLKANYPVPDLTVKQVADHVGLSPNYFSNVFKQYTGTTFNKYLTNFRIDKAKELLRTTDDTVYEVARRVGYDNANYFSAVFHRLTGVPPQTYREK
jgi:two-component system, response regulator YesN